MRWLATLWRTTTVRLTAIFIAIFGAFAILLLGILAYQASVQLQREQLTAIGREIQQIELLDRNGGVRAVAFAVSRLSERPGPGLYYLGDASGNILAGNVQALPAIVLADPGQYELTYDRGLEIYSTGEAAHEGQSVAVVRSLVLSNGLTLVVGRDVSERRYFTGVVFTTFMWGTLAIVVLSVLAGGLTARRVLRRIDAITGTSRKIMRGNLSERVPVTGRNDEFDEVAISQNAMLDRIEQLMAGMKEVTDNVAHDLKTPLTRLRSRAEAALRLSARDEDRRDALEATIAEADQLIRTFNALLLIARAEAGTPSGALARTDISAIVSDVAELYAPVAEDAGIAIKTEVESGIIFMANKELIGQALVNLVENAIKYLPEAGREDGVITIAARRDGKDNVVEVSDNGPGIPEADRRRVLERFVRLETSRTEPGSGLGLALVSAVAGLHNGTIAILDNAPGTRVELRFPQS